MLNITHLHGSKFNLSTFKTNLKKWFPQAVVKAPC